MKNRIYVQLDFYFPFSMFFLAIIGCIAGGVLLLIKPIVAVPIILISVAILTARYRLEINLTAKSYHDYLWIAGFRKGEKGNFNHIECLFLNKNNYTQNINSRVSTMTRHGVEYNGYIKFDTDEVHLFSNDNKEKVIQKLRKIRAQLSGNIIQSTQITINPIIMDYSEKTAVVIE